MSTSARFPALGRQHRRSVLAVGVAAMVTGMALTLSAPTATSAAAAAAEATTTASPTPSPAGGTATPSPAPVPTATSTASTTASPTPAPTTPTPTPTATPWVRDYVYGFGEPLVSTAWGRYGWGTQPVGNGAMGLYKPDNAFTHDGVLGLRTIYRDGQWSSAGVCGKPSFSAVGGRWEVRAKMPVAKGVGYAFLLYPTDGTWPPEVDIAEGRVNGRVGSFYHWGTPQTHHQAQSISTPDTHQWHTYGVILEGSTVTFTLDGKESGRITNVPVTTKRMWLGFQTGAMDPKGSAKAYETVDGGVPNALTPASSEIMIDWVAHYRR